MVARPKVSEKSKLAPPGDQEHRLEGQQLNGHGNAGEQKRRQIFSQHQPPPFHRIDEKRFQRSPLPLPGRGVDGQVNAAHEQIEYEQRGHHEQQYFGDVLARRNVDAVDDEGLEDLDVQPPRLNAPVPDIAVVSAQYGHHAVERDQARQP